MIFRHIQSLFQLPTTSIEVLRLHCLLLKTGLDHHEYFFSKLILSTSTVDLGHARKVFDNSPIIPPPLFAWNTLIRSYSNNSSTSLESVKLFVELLRAPGELKPDRFTYPFVIKSCGRCLMLGVGGSVHSMAFKVGFGSDSHVNNTLLKMYGGCGVAEMSRCVFDEMLERNVVSWSSLIAAFVDCDRASDALMIFKDMMRINGKPNSVTLVSLIAACTNLLDVRLGKSIHSYIVGNGIELHVALGTALLNMYAKSGHIEEALHIFNSIGDKNLQSWTVMISCLADNGHGEEAISLFTRMEKAGFRPDSVSFSTILSACSHRGLVHEGQEIFEKMVKVHNILPTMEHYGCMVDLFGRAGKIEEAYAIILSMQMEPNSVILRSYLSACKHQGRVLYVDEHLVNLLLEKEPENGASHVLAASISSLYGHMTCNSLRNDIKPKAFKKVPGCSWVQFPGKDQASVVVAFYRGVMG